MGIASSDENRICGKAGFGRLKNIK